MQWPIHCKKSSFWFIQTIFCKQLYGLVFFVRIVFFLHFISFDFGFVCLFFFFQQRFFSLFVVVINLFLLFYSFGWLLFGCSPFAVRFVHWTYGRTPNTFLIICLFVSRFMFHVGGRQWLQPISLNSDFAHRMHTTARLDTRIGIKWFSFEIKWTTRISQRAINCGIFSMGEYNFVALSIN